MKIAFFGTSDFAVPTLQKLIEDGHDIVVVYTQPPRKSGRGGKLKNTPVYNVAESFNLNIRCPEKLRNNDIEKEWFLSQDIDIAVVASYGLILPEYIIDYPKKGCINVHASLLPKWRGASPIQQAILSNDTETGITIIQMDYGLDTGPIICSEYTEIGDKDYITLHNELSNIGANLISNVLKETDIKSSPQQNMNASYAPKITKEDGKINCNNTAFYIAKQVRAYTPSPSVYFEYNGEKLKVGKVTPIYYDDDNIGTIHIEGKTMFIICADKTALYVEQLQRPSKTMMSIENHINNNIFKNLDKIEC